MGSVNLLPNLRSGCGVHVNDVPAIHRFVCRLAALFAAPAQAAPELVTPLDPCYVVAQENQRQPVLVAAKGFTPLSRRRHLHRQHPPDHHAGRSGTGRSTGMCSPRSRRRARARSRCACQRLRCRRTRSQRRRWSRDLRSSSRPRGRRRRSGCASRAAASRRPACPSTRTTCSRARSRKSVRLGLPKGPCGTFNFKRKQFPFKKSPRRGTWTIQFDQHPQYNPKAPVRVPMTIRVQRLAKQESVRAR